MSCSACQHVLSCDTGGRFPRPVAGDGAAAAVSQLWLPDAASDTGVEDGRQGEGQGHILICCSSVRTK